MEDIKQKAKQVILQEIMDLMDEKMNDGLKSKSPKFMKVEVEAESDRMPEELSSMEEPDESVEKEEVSTDNPDDLERLKELYSKLK
jgi:hypothetical protein